MPKQETKEELPAVIAMPAPTPSSDNSDQMQVASLDNLFSDEPKKSEPLPPVIEAPAPAEPQAEKTPTTPPTLNTGATLPTADIEAIVRAHTEEYLTTHVTKQLQTILEKIVREELNKALEEEIRLNQDLNDQP